jgi:hypothetical protein
VPAFCDSLSHYDTTLIFGRTFLKSVFQTMRKQLLDKFQVPDGFGPSLRQPEVVDWQKFVIW